MTETDHNCDFYLTSLKREINTRLLQSCQHIQVTAAAMVIYGEALAFL